VLCRAGWEEAESRRAADTAAEALEEGLVAAAVADMVHGVCRVCGAPKS
jgi:hypothetical protein